MYQKWLLKSCENSFFIIFFHFLNWTIGRLCECEGHRCLFIECVVFNTFYACHANHFIWNVRIHFQVLTAQSIHKLTFYEMVCRIQRTQAKSINCCVIFFVCLGSLLSCAQTLVVLIIRDSVSCFATLV